jgi:transaldolase
LHAQAICPNLLIKIAGTREGSPAIKEAIFAGVPVNVTLLFSPDHSRAAVAAYLRRIQRRTEAGLNPRVECVVLVFVSRWDNAVEGKTPDEFHNRLGIDMDVLAARLQKEGAESFVKSWEERMDVVAKKAQALK